MNKNYKTIFLFCILLVTIFFVFPINKIYAEDFTVIDNVENIITRTLKLAVPRMTGEDIKALQIYLTSNGYECGIADGVYGAKTIRAVISFQVANNLITDGIVGEKTKNKLSALKINSIPGCIANNMFSVLTGVSCITGLPPLKPGVFSGWYVNRVAKEDDFTLTYLTDLNGSITGSTTQIIKKGLSGTEVIAVPNDNYYFVGWSDGVMTNIRTDSNVMIDKSVTAIFALPVMGGEVSVIGDLKYGQELNVDVSNITYTPISPELNNFSYRWYRNGELISGETLSTYILKEEDIGANIYVIIDSDNIHSTGSITSNETGVVLKVDVLAPDAPVLESKSSANITLVSNELNEFSKDGNNWQDSNVFNNLDASTTYNFITRLKETSTANASEASLPTSITTDDPPPVVVSGNIIYANASSTPMNNVTIYLKQGGNTIYSTATQASGTANYNFPNVAPGSYDVYFSLDKASGGIVVSDASRINAFLLNNTVYGGINILAMDVYENSPDTIITGDDSSTILNYFVNLGSPPFAPGKWVFAKSENKTTSYSNFPIQFAAGDTTERFSNMTINISDSNVVQNFVSLEYGDVNNSFTPAP